LAMLDNQSFLHIIDKTPLVSVDLIIERSNGDILLGKRKNKPAQGAWFVPGGRILKNETIEQAFQRISQKELGSLLSFNTANLLGCYNHIYSDNFLNQSDVNTHYVVLAYSVQWPDTEQLKTDDQHETFSWWSRSRLMCSSKVHSNTKAYFK
ncbi:MAG: GDP-mannose mannosyl hydrolase, partial [Sinobacterium sp.]|nr:GDP-mannose mannosyl hydrolase [Sinobacterium sp.]